MCCTFNALAAEEIYRWGLDDDDDIGDDNDEDDDDDDDDQICDKFWFLCQGIKVFYLCCESSKAKCPRLV